MTEEQILQNLTQKFNFSEESIRVQRIRRIWINVEYERFFEIFDYIVKELSFTHLCAMTGVDSGSVFEVIYHISNENGIVISLKTNTPRETPKIKTITEYFADAGIYEKELIDLFGIEVEGTPVGPRYPLSDDWPEGEYPLRKDWKPKESEAITNG